MKIGFVTPIDRRSAIAQVSLDLVPHLQSWADVTVLAEPTSQPRPCEHALRTIEGIEDRDLDEFDYVLAAVGNSGFHSEALRLARHRPMIVILHDVVVAHAMTGVCGPRDAVREIRRWYGNSRADEAAASLMTNEPFWEREDVGQTPMFESVLEHAEGVITHSQFAAAQIRPRTLAPVRVLALPHTSRSISEEMQSQPIRLLTIGHANKNKCHELVVEALSALGRDDVEYAVVGSIHPLRHRHLEELAQSLGVASQVRILGALPDTDLLHLLATSTVGLNLRQPPIEAASASVLEQMSAGIPTVVFDHGFYAELPDDAVCKLPPSTSAERLAVELAELLDDPERRRTMGFAARRYVSQVHRADSYAAGLLDFIDQVDSHRPYARMAEAVGNAMRRCETPVGSTLATRWSGIATAMISRTPRNGP